MRNYFHQPLNEKRFTQFVQIIGALFFGFLTILSIIFFKERMLAYDSANYCLEIEQVRHFCLPHGRWSSVFSQTVPLLSLNWGCSLEFFLKVYSASFMVINYLIFLICTLFFRNHKAGLVLLLSMSLGFCWMYYYAISELFSGMSFSVLLYATVSHMSIQQSSVKKMIYLVISFGLVYTISYFHQLALFPALFVILYEIISNKRYRQKWVIGLFALVVLWSYLRIKVFSVADYTHGKILSYDTYLSQLNNVFQLEAWKYYVHYITSTVKWLLYLAIGCSLVLIWKKKWLELLLFGVFFLAYPLLIVLTYYKGESGLMIETYLPPLGLFTAMVFVHQFSAFNARKIFLAITCWLLFVSGRNIFLASSIQIERTDYLERLIDYGRNLPNKKYVIDEKNVPVDLVKVPWALPLETVLMSALHPEGGTVSFAIRSEGQDLSGQMKNPEEFIGPSWQPEWYFSNDNLVALPSLEYLSVTSSQDDSDFVAARFNQGNLKIVPIEDKLEVPYHQFGFTSVKIINTSGQRLNSGLSSIDPIVLSYKIYSLSGEQIAQEPRVTPLDVDVYTTYVQAVRVNSPRDAGDYILEIDFTGGGRLWWNCGARMKLHIPGKSIFRWL